MIRKHSVTLSAFLLLLGTLAFAGDKYPLTMKAVFTKGKISKPDRGEMYHSGDYDCTQGDEHNAPDCRTITEWAELDSIGGEPDTIVFTMADGSQVGVQSTTIHKIPGYIECSPASSIIFCSLYFEFLERQQVSLTKTSPYGQTEFLSAEEHAAAQDARNRELFADGNTMTLTFRYKLKGRPQDGFQRIEIDKTSCVVRDLVNHCDAGLTHLLNARGDGYVLQGKLASK
jgi:hypothetical protein